VRNVRYQKLLVSLGSSIALERRDIVGPDALLVHHRNDDPWLLVDSGITDTKIMILRPADNELSFAYARDFKLEQAIRFAQLMRERSERPFNNLPSSLVFEGPGLRGFLFYLKLAPRPVERSS
jgi:hypothetical protein